MATDTTKNKPKTDRSKEERNRFREEKTKYERIRLFKEWSNSNFMACHPQYRIGVRRALRKLIGRKRIIG